MKTIDEIIEFCRGRNDCVYVSIPFKCGSGIKTLDVKNPFFKSEDSFFKSFTWLEAEKQTAKEIIGLINKYYDKGAFSHVFDCSDLIDEIIQKYNTESEE